MKKIVSLVLVAIMALAFAIPTSAASYTVSDPKWVTIDGKISQEEWGNPIYKGVTLQQAEDKKVDDVLTCWWFDATNNAEASFDLYLTHNDQNLFLGCVIHDVDAETCTDGYGWQQMNFVFTVSDYNEGTDVRHIKFEGKEYEAYTGYRILLDAKGRLTAQPITQGLTAKNLYAGEDYQAVYNPADRTMTYEVAVPFDLTYINPNTTKEIALSAVVALNQYGNTVSGQADGSNRWLVGTGTAFCGGPENWAHKGQCIRIKLVAPEKVIENMPSESIPNAPGMSYNKDVDVEISSEPQYNAITSDEPISTPLIIIFASVAVVVLCAVAVTVTLVRDRNKKAAKAAAKAAAADGKDGEEA